MREAERSQGSLRGHRQGVCVARAAIILVAAGVSWIVARSLSGAQELGFLRFRTGFTPFPYDMTLEAMLGTRQFLQDHGDIVAFHIQGVPWAECLEEKPFSPKLLEDWEGQEHALANGSKVYLAISPGHGALKEGEKSLPIPARLGGNRMTTHLSKRRIWPTAGA
jgi:hypothetical protein